jgi:hypothetical protein
LTPRGSSARALLRNRPSAADLSKGDLRTPLEDGERKAKGVKKMPPGSCTKAINLEIIFFVQLAFIEVAAMVPRKDRGERPALIVALFTSVTQALQSLLRS